MTDPKSHLGAVEQSEEAAGLYDRPVTVQGARVVRLSRHGSYAVLGCRESGQVVQLDLHAIILAALALGLSVSEPTLTEAALTGVLRRSIGEPRVNTTAREIEVPIPTERT